MDEQQEVIQVSGEQIVVTGTQVTIAYQQQTEYSDNEILMQINNNIVDSCGIISAFFGMLMGFFACKELLKIWLK